MTPHGKAPRHTRRDLALWHFLVSHGPCRVGDLHRKGFGETIHNAPTAASLVRAGLARYTGLYFGVPINYRTIQAEQRT